MTAGRALLGVVCLLTAVLPSDAVLAQQRVFRSTTRQEEPSLLEIRVPSLVVGSDFDGYRVQSGDPYSSGRFVEWARFRLRANVVSPRYLTLDVVASPLFGQGWDGRSEGGLARDGLNTHARLNVFRGFGIQGTLEAERENDFQDLQFGGFQRIAETTWRAAVRDVNPLLPVEALFEEVNGQRVFGTGGELPPLAIDRKVKRFRFQGQNSKTRILAERVDHTSRTETETDRFLRDRATLENRHRWGKGSSMLARVDYRRRRLDAEFSAFTASEYVRLQHFPFLFSEYRFLYSTEEGEGFEGSGTEGEVKVTANVGKTLSSTLGFVRLAREIDSSRFTEKRLQPQLRLLTDLFGELRTDLSMAAAFAWRHREDVAPEFGHIVEERHLLDASGRFKLLEPFVDPASVHLERADDGTRYDENLDYRLVEEGPFLLVVVLPGGRILEGTEVVASYRYRIDPAPTDTYLDLRTRLTLGWRGFRLFGSRAYRDGGSGGPGHTALSLRGLDHTRVGLRWEYASLRFRTGVSAEWERSVTDDFQLDTRSAGSDVAVQLTPGLTAVLDADWMEGRWAATSFTTTEVENRLTWTPRRTVTVTGRFSLLDWDQDRRQERHIGYGAGVAWRTGAQKLEVLFDRSRWDRAVPLLRDRVTIRVSRELR